MGRDRRDLRKQRFGRLTATRSGYTHESGATTWDCRCDCGAVCTVITSNLTAGRTKSCGCLRREASRRPRAMREIGATP